MPGLAGAAASDVTVRESWLRELVQRAAPGRAAAKTQFAATQMEAANEGRKVTTSAARGHLPTLGK